MRKRTPPHSISKRAKQVRQQMAAIVAAGASLLGSQRSRRPRLSRSCSGSAAIQSRPGWLAVQPARRQCDGRHPRQSVCIAARWACWLQKQVSIVPQFESAALDRGCRTAPAATIWLGAEQGANSAVAIRTTEIYRSANGDRWLLACDSDTARVFVRHEPNLPSGGQVADIELEPF